MEDETAPARRDLTTTGLLLVLLIIMFVTMIIMSVTFVRLGMIDQKLNAVLALQGGGERFFYAP
jgi:hypothetical protein